MNYRKYWSVVWEMVEQAEVVLEVVDSRYPSICRSNQLEDHVKETADKTLVIILSKSDLIPRAHGEKWVKWFKQNENITAIPISSKKRLGTSNLQKQILRSSPKKRANVAVVGFPNTGKSSLINRLKGKKSAATAPVAGWTKNKQTINISKSITMFDTPGILPIKLPLKHQYLLGVIPTTKISDPIYAAEILIDQFEALNPGAIFEMYDLPKRSENLLEHLAIRLGRIQKGGVPDERAGAIALLNDHMKGKIQIFENSQNPLRYLN